LIEQNKIEAYKKTQQWQEAVVKEYFKLSSQLKLDRQMHIALNYPKGLPDRSFATDPIDFFKKNPPLASLVLNFNQRTIDKIIEYLCNFLRLNYDKDLDSDSEESFITDIDKETKTIINTKRKESSSASSTTINCLDLAGSERWFALWLYAVYLLTDLDLSASSIANLREITRILIVNRQYVSPDCSLNVRAYSIFLTIIANCFRQLDFIPFI